MNLAQLLRDVITLSVQTGEWIEQEKSAAHVNVDLKFLNNLVTM